MGNVTCTGRVEKWWAKKREHIEPLQSWLGLMAALMTIFLLSLTATTFPIIYDDIVNRYGSTISEAGWTVSVHWITVCLTGLFISPLVTRYGSRNVTFASGLLYGTGVILSAVAPNAPLFSMLYGALTGIGDSCGYNAVMTFVQHRFTHNLGLANGVAALGLGLGAVIHPVYTVPLLDAYGMFGLLLIQGALCLNIVVFALALKPLAVPNKERRISQNGAHNNAEDLTNVQRNQDVRGLNTLNPITAISDYSTYQDHYLPGKDQSNTRKTVHSMNNVSDDGRYIQDKDQNNTKNPNTEQTGHSMNNISDAGSKKHKRNSDSTREYLRDMLDFTPLRDISFTLSVMYFFFLWINRLGVVSHIVSAAKHHGIQPGQAAFLTSILGFVSVVTGITVAMLMNFSWMNPALLCGLAALSAGLSALVPAYFTSYGWFATSSVLMGVSDGIAIGNVPMLIVYVLGKDRFTRGLALMWFLQFPALMGATPFTGWLVDRSGNYKFAFLVLGSSGALSCVLAVIVFVLKKVKKKKNEKEHSTMCESNETIITHF